MDYGFELENEWLYFLVESNENKLEDIKKEILVEIKCGVVKCKFSDVYEGNNDVEKYVVVCMNNLYLKGFFLLRSFRLK